MVDIEHRRRSPVLVENDANWRLENPLPAPAAAKRVHQLRGRVGRGEKESYCILLYQAPLSYKAQQRLDIMRRTQDGFVIADKDLELRGAGDLLGTQQTGDIQFKVARISQDHALVEQASETVENPEHHKTLAKEQLLKRWFHGASELVTV